MLLILKNDEWKMKVEFNRYSHWLFKPSRKRTFINPLSTKRIYTITGAIK